MGLQTQPFECWFSDQFHSSVETVKYTMLYLIRFLQMTFSACQRVAFCCVVFKMKCSCSCYCCGLCCCCCCCLSWWFCCWQSCCCRIWRCCCWQSCCNCRRCNGMTVSNINTTKMLHETFLSNQSQCKYNHVYSQIKVWRHCDTNWNKIFF